MVAQPDAGRRRGKVLVVEDVAPTRIRMDMAEQLGFETMEAGEANKALALIQRHSGITILLTDLGLPGMNGRRLVEKALRPRLGLKVAIASGYSTDGKESLAFARGAVYLIKPCDTN